MDGASPGIAVDRVVAVLSTLESGLRQVGTGYIVSSRVVLTALHCTRDKLTETRPASLQVVRASDGSAVGATVLAASDPLDVAALALDDAPWLTDVAAPRFGRVDRSATLELDGCEALGYPWWQFDAALEWRNTAALRGAIRVTDDSGSGFLVLRDPLLDTVQAPDASPSGGSQAVEPKSPWGGLSGAVVFCAEYALGVIVQHEVRQGAAAVRLVPFDRIAAAREPGARAIAEALGLPSVDFLPVIRSGEAQSALTAMAEWVVEGAFPRVRSLDPYQLGATSSTYGRRDQHGARDPYVPRQVDGALRAALKPGRFVLVVGPSKSGKTRTAYEAALSRWLDARLVAPTADGLAALADDPRFRDLAEPVVLWFDNLQDYLGGAHPLTPWLLARLLSRAHPTIGLATIRLEQRDRLRDSRGELSSEAAGVLAAADATIELASTTQDQGEQAAARRAYPAEDLASVGLAERLANAPVALERYREAADAQIPLGYVIVRTAIDWARIGGPRPIPEADLVAIAQDALWNERPDLDVDAGQLDAAIRWARDPLPGSGRVALLGTAPLPEHRRGYWAFDYLVAADDGQDGLARPIPDSLLDQIVKRVMPEDAFGVGATAILRENWTAAKLANCRAANGGIPGAMFFLAVILADEDPPDRAGALHWLERAGELGHTAAMNQLGVMLEQADPPDLDGARAWFTRAAQMGRVGAMTNLARLLERAQPPDMHGAALWWRQAAERGDLSAMTNLGLLLARRDPPDLYEAARLWQRAARGGEPQALFNLGVLHETEDAPDLQAARDLYVRAAIAGSASAPARLGRVLAELESPAGPEAAPDPARAAREANPEAEAMLYIGAVLIRRDPPDKDGAGQWVSRAATAGNLDARELLAAIDAESAPPADPP